MGGTMSEPHGVAEHAAALYRDGVPVRKILDRTGLTQPELFSILEAHGLRRGRGHARDAGLHEIRQELDEAREAIGALQAEIAALREQIVQVSEAVT